MRVQLVLPPFLSPAAYSVAVQRTAAMVTAPSKVALTSGLPVTRPVVSVRILAFTMLNSSAANPVCVPVVRLIISGYTPSVRRSAVCDADDSWD